MNRKEWKAKQCELEDMVIASKELPIRMKEALIDFIYYQQTEVIVPKCRPSAGALGEREAGK